MRVSGYAVRETVSFVAESSPDPFTRVLNEVISHPAVGPYELAVFCRMAIHANWQASGWDGVWPSMETVARKTGKPMSRDRAFKALKVLQDTGFLRAGKKPFGAPVTYEIRLPRQSSARRTIDSPIPGSISTSGVQGGVRVADTNETLNQRTRKTARAAHLNRRAEADRHRPAFFAAHGRIPASVDEVLEWAAAREAVQ